jgi:hypothetical protein
VAVVGWQWGVGLFGIKDARFKCGYFEPKIVGFEWVLREIRLLQKKINSISKKKMIICKSEP